MQPCSSSDHSEVCVVGGSPCSPAPPLTTVECVWWAGRCDVRSSLPPRPAASGGCYRCHGALVMSGIFPSPTLRGTLVAASFLGRSLQCVSPPPIAWGRHSELHMLLGGGGDGGGGGRFVHCYYPNCSPISVLKCFSIAVYVNLRNKVGNLSWKTEVIDELTSSGSKGLTAGLMIFASKMTMLNASEVNESV